MEAAESKKQPSLKFEGIEYVLERIPLALIDLSQYQPDARRRSLDPETLSQKRADLIASVAAHGQYQPIDVHSHQSPEGPMRFMLIDGEGRVTALRKDGRTHALARVFKITAPEDVPRIRDAIFKTKGTESKTSGADLVSYIYKTLAAGESLAERKEGAKQFREAAETVEFAEGAFDEPEFGDMVAGRHATGSKPPLSPDMLKSARAAAKLLLNLGSYDRLQPDRNPEHRETLIRALRWTYEHQMTRAVVDYRKNIDRYGPGHLKRAVAAWKPLEPKLYGAVDPA